MHDLSDEIMMLILSCVPPLDLLRSVSLVSKNFSSLIRQETFWHHHPPLSQSQWQQFLQLQHQLERNPYSSASMKARSIQMFCACVFHQSQGSQASASRTSHTSHTSHTNANENENTDREQDNTRTTAPAPTPTPTPTRQPNFLQQKSLLPDRETAMSLPHRRKRCCLASSTEHSREALENVLLDPGENINPPSHPSTQRPGRIVFSRLNSRWWSSMPSNDTQSNETLLFRLMHHVAIISEIQIKPLREPFFQHGTVYTWKQMVIRAYLLPPQDQQQHEHHHHHQQHLNNTDEAHVRFFDFQSTTASSHSDHHHFQPDDALLRNDQHAIDTILHTLDPVYDTSRDNDKNSIAPNNSSSSSNNNNNNNNSTAATNIIPPDSDQVLTVTFPPGIIANVIAIDLLGKNYEQSPNMGYYACVERIDCRGFPLL